MYISHRAIPRNKNPKFTALLAYYQADIQKQKQEKNIFAQLEQLYIGYIKQLGLPSIVDSP